MVYFSLIVHGHHFSELSRYRIYDIGQHQNYIDEAYQKYKFRKEIEESVNPLNSLLLTLLNKYPDSFSVSFSLSGDFINSLKLFMPHSLDTFKSIVTTSQIDLLSQTYHELIPDLINEKELSYQIEKHSQLIDSTFKQLPRTYYNSYNILDESFFSLIDKMGFNSVINSNHILLSEKKRNKVYQSEQGQVYLFSNQSFTSILNQITYLDSKEIFNKLVSFFEKESENSEVITLELDYSNLHKISLENSKVFDLLYRLFSFLIREKKAKFISSSSFEDFPTKEINQLTLLNNQESFFPTRIQNHAYGYLQDIYTSFSSSSLDPYKLDPLRTLADSKHFDQMNFYLDESLVSTPYDYYIHYVNSLTDIEERLTSLVKKNTYEKELKKETLEK